MDIHKAFIIFSIIIIIIIIIIIKVLFLMTPLIHQGDEMKYVKSIMLGMG